MKEIKKQKWKAGNMIYPLPAAMVSCGDLERTNIVTVGWTGTICTNPAMTYISLRKSRFSYDIIKETGYFVINLTTRDLAYATDYCGVKSGRDVNKFEQMHLTPIWDEDTKCPMIGESPVSVVCEVTEIKELGSHDMFIAKVLNVYVNEAFLDEKGKCTELENEKIYKAIEEAEKIENPNISEFEVQEKIDEMSDKFQKKLD
jgi:flavin reductase (DIM6/NTAB) family NADH-FMN oxidoreductase RutF